MTDPLMLLDEAIDRLASATSSRCSRSGAAVGMPTGTVSPLKTDTVPVVPVVPVQNRWSNGGTACRSEDPRSDESTPEKKSHASTILKRTGTTGTTGTDLINHRLTVPVVDSGNGNNGNCLQGMQRVGLDAAMAAYLGDGAGIDDVYSIGINKLNQEREHSDKRQIALLDGPHNHHLEASTGIHLPADVLRQRPVDQPRMALSRLPGVPQEWLVGLASMSRMAVPAGIAPDDWEGLVRGASRLLEERGARLASLGWVTADLFAVHRSRPLSRNDYAGLVRFVGRDEVRAVTATTVTLRTRSGATQTFYRRTPFSSDWVMMWQLDDQLHRA